MVCGEARCLGHNGTRHLRVELISTAASVHPQGRVRCRVPGGRHATGFLSRT